MGGGPGYVIPAPYTGMSTRDAHLKRRPPSSEPGTDYYMPRGTPLVVPSACRVVAVGGGLGPATGRFVMLDNGARWMRFLHLLESHVRVNQELPEGTVFGLSGASGYGSEHFGAASDTDGAMIARTGGPHVHVTAFRGRAFTLGSGGTVDFHALTGGAVAGNVTAKPEIEEEKEEDMTQLIGNSKDGYKLVDELGADNWASFAYTGPGSTFEANWEAVNILGDRVDMEGGWGLETLRHMANARWDQKRSQIAAEVIKGIAPLLAATASGGGLTEERFAQLLEEGLNKLKLNGPQISEADQDALAEAVRQKFREDPLA
ncbi:M23 family metallopeptidase [Microbacterium sp. Leaf320]|uniref:M23 family metallopeptidase n=1 Tax=Microbacterium sp. Leaf320 TaxID=1736334 RepID=UPI0007003A3E|nr:M23 family metallopeptidase [Microbacterium sp. Leaf320]KQQ65694.1 hypothetical protein ASF63_10050 [Microbacterium sp. Leaf320]